MALTDIKVKTAKPKEKPYNPISCLMVAVCIYSLTLMVLNIGV